MPTESIANLINSILILWAMLGPMILIGLDPKVAANLSVPQQLRILFAGPGIWGLILASMIDSWLRKRRKARSAACTTKP